MKVSKEQLKVLIKEELEAVMKEEETYAPRKDPAVQKMAGDAVRDAKARKGIEKNERDQIKKAQGHTTNPVGQKDRDTSDEKLTGTFRGSKDPGKRKGGYFGLEEAVDELEEGQEELEENKEELEEVKAHEGSEEKEEHKGETKAEKAKHEEGESAAEEKKEHMKEDKQMEQIAESFRRFTKILKS